MSENEKILVELETLPKGGITYKKINGRAYAYYQWTQDGRQHSRRVKDEELEELSEKIRRRKELQEQVKGAGITAIKKVNPDTVFQCAVRVGADLVRFAKPVSGWKKKGVLCPVKGICIWKHFRSCLYFIWIAQNREDNLDQTVHPGYE